ncbi:NifB/NifX family molybdenum-iron cluster-binding protein [Maridesulfovibrio bastinii]|jgi:predicted Fe-Mo cluster-binding NifX family protein|uniref:NifB/NifX family molybdenum-iron cluster-binding protein n=1 Tax=Maridesulfovibrio bastinii TaxID=47157 RepID=UPI000685659B|nr:NifB/NifX family molybdenum-iron cluster-binding protein [Maridesulfovibrio bastinii]
MLLCLACYNDRLASVFDNATEFKIFRIEENNICPAGHLSLPSKDPKDRTSAILACGATTLICGALCGCTRNLIESTGVKVVPWIRGTVEEVLAAVSDNCLDSLAMPGCSKGTGQGRCRRQSGNGSGFHGHGFV